MVEAIDGFLANLDHPETAGTRRVYASTLRQVREHLGAATPLVVLDTPAAAAALVAWFTARWGERAPATFNRNLDTLRSAIGYWREQDWLAGDPSRALRRRGRAPDRTRALGREEDHRAAEPGGSAAAGTDAVAAAAPSAARAGEVLALDVEDLDLRNRCAKVRRKGNAVDVIVWQTGTARLLPRLLKGRSGGRCPSLTAAPGCPWPPLTCTSRPGRPDCPTAAPPNASPRSPAARTLHQLRHSALTHAAEDGANTSTLLSFSGHTSVASLARYARVSPEALRRWRRRRDPATRRR